jgi:hypothetical protein
MISGEHCNGEKYTGPSRGKLSETGKLLYTVYFGQTDFISTSLQHSQQGWRSTVQCSAVQCSAVQCSAVQCTIVEKS